MTAYHFAIVAPRPTVRIAKLDIEKYKEKIKKEFFDTVQDNLSGEELMEEMRLYLRAKMGKLSELLDSLPDDYVVITSDVMVRGAEILDPEKNDSH